MLKIYFGGSITGGRGDAELYKQIIEHLKNHGTVLTEHIGSATLGALGESLRNKHIHDRDMAWLEEADVVVAEVTQTSLGVGYELGRMVERNMRSDKRKALLCLYRPQVDRKLSAMISGSEGLVTLEYQTLEEAKKIIDEFFAKQALEIAS